IRFTYDPYFGLNAVVRNNKGIYYIDSYSKDNNMYIVYNSKDAQSLGTFECLFNNELPKPAVGDYNTYKGKQANDGLLRKYRIAISTTKGYTDYIAQQAGLSGGTVAQKKAAVLAAVNLVIARVNEIYENDLSVTFQLAANTDQLFFVDSDPFGQTDTDVPLDFYFGLLDLATTNLSVTDSIIGAENYDLTELFFHSFNTLQQAGISLSKACDDEKGEGAMGMIDPVGDPFAAGMVSHEIGHQFGAFHTQNNDCQREDTTDVEPGSGSTIMGYAGICAPNVQLQGDAYFNTISIQQMNSKIMDTITCGTTSSTGNRAPLANAGQDKVIPKETPFALTGVGSDPDGDAITYTWDQIDTGVGQMPPRSTNSVGPLFRSIWGTTSPTRYFPKLSTIVEGYDPSILDPGNYRAWEKLPSVDRTLNFALLVRDNNHMGGRTSSDVVKLTVSSSAGPFLVTSQNTQGVIWNAGEIKTISWDVANTNAAPVNTANVMILLSTDGGNTFPYTLAESVPNNGSYSFTVPANIDQTSKARIMVKAVDNVFLNVNAKDFTINNSYLMTDEVEKEGESIIIYPNPSKGIFTIKTQSKNDISYTVYTVDGRRIDMPQRISSKGGRIEKKIDLSSLVAGVYFIEIDKDGRKLSKKLIISK
ncbi:reprolysin-like metallopeptidase, partial [Chryseobacterium sp.]|uniref:zinc-dependent metalloprotease n=1 Tax=Chryseobacterium sp. TaxID=1871047 RepID=UPI0025BD852E